jgi:hypothetical protein
MPGDPHCGSKVWKAPDREIGKPRENRGKAIAHHGIQPLHRETRKVAKTGDWAGAVETSAIHPIFQYREV